MLTPEGLAVQRARDARRARRDRSGRGVHGRVNVRTLMRPSNLKRKGGM